MRLALHVAPTAKRQIRQAARWWRRNRPAARDLLHRELARAFDPLTTSPLAAPRALDVELAGTRRVLLERIRYHLYFRVIDGERVEVLALWHTSRGGPPELGREASS